MPLYAYTCEKCEKDFEAITNLKDADDAECPDCGSGNVERHLSLPSKATLPAATNCRGDGPPCGAPYCGRK